MPQCGAHIRWEPRAPMPRTPSLPSSSLPLAAPPRLRRAGGGTPPELLRRRGAVHSVSSSLLAPGWRGERTVGGGWAGQGPASGTHRGDHYTGCVHRRTAQPARSQKRQRRPAVPQSLPHLGSCGAAQADTGARRHHVALPHDDSIGQHRAGAHRRAGLDNNMLTQQAVHHTGAVADGHIVLRGRDGRGSRGTGPGSGAACGAV